MYALDNVGFQRYTYNYILPGVIPMNSFLPTKNFNFNFNFNFNLQRQSCIFHFTCPHPLTISLFQVRYVQPIYIYSRSLVLP